MYRYNGKVTRILDANTLEVEVDLGFDIKIKRVFAVNGMTAPTYQSDPVAADAAKAIAIQLVSQRTIELDTHRIGRFGRYAATIRFLDGKLYKEAFDNLSQSMVQ